MITFHSNYKFSFFRKLRLETDYRLDRRWHHGIFDGTKYSHNSLIAYPLIGNFLRKRCMALYNKISSGKSAKTVFIFSVYFRFRNDLMSVCLLIFTSAFWRTVVQRHWQLAGYDCILAKGLQLRNRLCYRAETKCKMILVTFLENSMIAIFEFRPRRPLSLYKSYARKT